MTDLSLNLHDIHLCRPEFLLLRDLVREKTGISLRENGKQLLESRLLSRLRDLNLPSFQAYYDYLQNDGHDSELQRMINRVTTNKTDFFRESHHFDFLAETILPAIVDRTVRENQPRKIRIWSAGCSTGEEACSAAITVLNSVPDFQLWDIRILASDIDTEVLYHADSGIYHNDRTDRLSPDDLRKYFIEGTGSGADSRLICPNVSELVTYKQINFLDSDWQINTQFDVIFCRNVLIYFDHEMQQRLMSRIAGYLRPDGFLFVGHSESLADLSSIYTHVGQTTYQLNTADAAGRNSLIVRESI